MALQLQKEMGRWRPRNSLTRAGGTDYPLDDDELAKQLEFLVTENPDFSPFAGGG